MVAQTEQKRGLAALIAEPPLSAQTCLSTNAKLGALMLVSGVMYLIGTAGKPDPTPIPKWGVAFQFIIGLVLVGGWARARGKPDRQPPIARIHGAILLALVIVYVLFMTAVVPRMMSSHMRVAHAPGILALGAGYSLRQILDFNRERSWSRVRRLVCIGIVAGAIGDVAVLVTIVRMFSQHFGR